MNPRLYWSLIAFVAIDVGRHDVGHNDAWSIRPAQTLVETSGEVTCLSLSPNGKTLAWGTDRGVLMAWNTQANERITRREPAETRVTSLVFSPDGRVLVAGTADKPNRLMVYDTHSVRWDERTLGGSGGRTITSTFIDRDSKTLVFTGYSVDSEVEGDEGESDIEFYDLVTLERCRFRTWKEGPERVAVSPDLRHLATAYKGSTKLFEIDGVGGELPDAHELIPGDSMSALAFSHDGKLLATGGGGWIGREPTPETAWAALCLWDVESKKERHVMERTVSRTTGPSQFEILRVAGHLNAVIECLQFSPDDRVLATGSTDSMIRLWDVATGKELVGIDAHERGVTALSWSRDGKRLATAGRGGEIKVWDVEKSK